MKASELKKKEVMVWRKKEVNNERKLGVLESNASTSSSGK